MRAQAGHFEPSEHHLELPIQINGDRDLAQQIYARLREGIVKGRLTAGEKLPSTRELATRLDVSRTTINEAFQRLLSEGYLRAARGSGTFVSSRVRFPLDGGNDPLSGAALAVSEWFKRLPETPDAPIPVVGEIDFRPGVPDLTHFPFGDWRRVLAQEMRPEDPENSNYSEAAGLEKLREEIAKRMRISRAVVCDAEDIIITSGAQQGLDLVARSVIDPGCVVAVEDPGYPAARHCFSALGARVVPVPVDTDGLIVRRLPSAARLVYVTPSHQFPLGPVLSFERRQALLDWARKRGAIIIEDDYDSEFRYTGRPHESLKAMDVNGVVAYLGTFSKSLLPGLRLGYLMPPSSLRSGLRTAKWLADRSAPATTQAAMARFMSSGLHSRYLRKMQKVYEDRFDVMTHGIRSMEKYGISLVPSSAGLHVAAHIHFKQDTDSVFSLPEIRKFGVRELAPFYVGKTKQGLVFGFGNTDVSLIRIGLKRISFHFECTRRRLTSVVSPSSSQP